MATEGVRQWGVVPMLQRWHFPGSVGCPECEPLCLFNGEPRPASADRLVVWAAVEESVRHPSAAAKPPLPISLREQSETLEHALSSAWHGKPPMLHASGTVAGALAMKYASRQASDIRRWPLNRMDFSLCTNLADYSAFIVYRPICQQNSSFFILFHQAFSGTHNCPPRSPQQ